MASKRILKILSIDPGLSKMGWSVSLHNKKTGEQIVKRFGTIEANRIVSRANMRETTSKFGTRLVALKYIEEKIKDLLKLHKPDYVVAESAFFCTRFPNAFTALVQVLNIIELSVYSVLGQAVYKISPKLAKAAISGLGTSNKDDVQKAVKDLTSIKFQQRKSTEDMNEHEADSIAIAHAFIVNVVPGL